MNTTMALEFFGLNVITVTETVIQTFFIPVYPNGTFHNITSTSYGPSETLTGVTTLSAMATTESREPMGFVDEKSLWRGPTDESNNYVKIEPTLTEIFGTTSPSTTNFEISNTIGESTIPLTNSGRKTHIHHGIPDSSDMNMSEISRQKVTSVDSFYLELSRTVNDGVSKKLELVEKTSHLPVSINISSKTSAIPSKFLSLSPTNIHYATKQKHEATLTITKSVPHVTRKYTPPIHGNVTLPNESNNYRLKAQKITFLLVLCSLAILFT